MCGDRSGVGVDRIVVRYALGIPLLTCGMSVFSSGSVSLVVTSCLVQCCRTLSLSRRVMMVPSGILLLVLLLL